MDRDVDDDPDTDETPARQVGIDSSSRHRVRHRTSPVGVPVPALVLDRPSRAVLEAALAEETATEPVGRAEAVALVRAELKEDTARRFRRVWSGLAAVAGSAIVALAAAAKGMLSDARSEGEAKVRIEIMERDLERLRTDLAAARMETDALRGMLYRTGRRDEPDPPITSASKRTPP